ncbi:unnamed protein product, partial [Peniophora sp. CBMAI 1063]
HPRNNLDDLGTFQLFGIGSPLGIYYYLAAAAAAPSTIYSRRA